MAYLLRAWLCWPSWFCCVILPLEVNQAVADGLTIRGKSGLHRARCQVMPGERKLTASATEKIPPCFLHGKGEMVR